MKRLAMSVARDKLASLGKFIGNFTDHKNIHMYISSLTYLFQVWETKNPVNMQIHKLQKPSTNFSILFIPYPFGHPIRMPIYIQFPHRHSIITSTSTTSHFSFFLSPTQHHVVWHHRSMVAPTSSTMTETQSSHETPHIVSFLLRARYNLEFSLHRAFIASSSWCTGLKYRISNIRDWVLK